MRFLLWRSVNRKIYQNVYLGPHFLQLHYFRWTIFEENIWSVSLSFYIWVCYDWKRIDHKYWTNKIIILTWFSQAFFDVAFWTMLRLGTSWMCNQTVDLKYLGWLRISLTNIWLFQIFILQWRAALTKKLFWTFLLQISQLKNHQNFTLVRPPLQHFPQKNHKKIQKNNFFFP